MGGSSFFGPGRSKNPPPSSKNPPHLRRSTTPPLLPSDLRPILRGRKSKMEGGSSISGAEDRRLKMGGGSSIFGSENRRWVGFNDLRGRRSKNPSPFSIFGAGRSKTPPSTLFDLRPRRSKNPPHLRSSTPKIEKHPPTFDFRSRILGQKSPLGCFSIFGAGNRSRKIEDPPSSIFDLRPRR